MNITIVGTGYVGLVSGACFADIGNKVTCLDIDKSRISKLKKAKVPFYEPGLEALLKKNIKNNNISFTSSYEEAISSCEVIFICVGTPEDETGSTDFSYLNNVVEDICNVLQSKALKIVTFIKSTVPPGTCEKLQAQFNESLHHSQSEIIVASNPEFLKEGAAIDDFMHPDRIIIGSSLSSVKQIGEAIYRPINWKSNRLKFVSIESAEIIKYASNAFLATKISFMNEISRLCDSVGADVNEVRIGVGLDSRINPNFLYSGMGFGGSCFPKDIKSLRNSFLENNIESNILASVLEVNETQKNYFLDKFYKFYRDKDLLELTISIWGLSFKPETDDIRESISIKIIKEISPKVKEIKAYDPVALDNSKEALNKCHNIVFCNSSEEAIQDANALFLTTEWKEFWEKDPKSFNPLLDKVIFDGRNVLNKELLEKKGFTYFGIGR